MMRHRLAGPWLSALRLGRGLGLVRAGGAFRILMLHDVPDAHLPSFELLVRHAKDAHGVLTPAEADSLLAGGPGPTPRGGRLPVLFSFDDGFASNAGPVAEILERHGVTAVFFVCPGLMDLEPAAQRAAIGANVFDGRRPVDSLPAGQRLMTWDEARALDGAGHRLAAHGMTHARLSRLSGADLEREIIASGDVLEDRVGRPVRWYAYAFGDVGSVSPEALSIIGRRFDVCRSGVRGANGAATRPLALRADQIDPGDGAPVAWRDLILEGGLDGRYRRARRRLDAMPSA